MWVMVMVAMMVSAVLGVGADRTRNRTALCTSLGMRATFLLEELSTRKVSILVGWRKGVVPHGRLSERECIEVSVLAEK